MCIKVSVTLSNEGLEGWLVGAGVGPFADLTIDIRTKKKFNYIVKGVLEEHSQQRRKVLMYSLAISANCSVLAQLCTSLDIFSPPVLVGAQRII